VGRCPDCGEFETFLEETVADHVPRSGPRAEPVPLSSVRAGADDRVATGLSEFDRVLGGGLVRDSVVLLGGQPGIGKSTLLLQAAMTMASQGSEIVYVCGEESPGQVRLRAERLAATHGDILLLPEVDAAAIEDTLSQRSPQLVIVDSIQTLFDPDVSGAPGSVSQVRACGSRLMRLAKSRGFAAVLVGHVTKDGSIAGPRVLEHMVDTVLYFEGDRDHAFRVVRAVKNRFGSASEIGIFEMGSTGLVGVDSASEALVAQRAEPVAGATIMATVEGSRALLVEIQALVSPSYLDMPRRLATGVDRGRLLQVIAVLERRAGLSFGQHDVYVSVTGGVRVLEPAADLPLALALGSARRDATPAALMASFGEVGLTGEIRPVANSSSRLGEVARMGLELAVGPEGIGDCDGVSVVECATLSGALEAALP
jgi:DNA repair protein RadA/Sms